jgi:CBS domain-containing protein
MKIAAILATKGADVETIAPDRRVRDAVALLARRNIGAVVVVDEHERPVGIMSERDVVRAAATDEGILARRVADIMTRDLVTATPDDDLLSVAHVMTERRIRHLPVVQTGRLVGIVSIGDVVKAQRDQYQGQLDTLQVQLEGRL